MHAIGYRHPGPLTNPVIFEAAERPDPRPEEHDVVVRVEAVSVNPADAKIRASAVPAEGFRVLGYDAAGVVVATGPAASRFRPGDRVWYAGAIDRPGSNAELQAVDERLVGRMPSSLGFAEAAALPLTTITAWEALFDRFDVARPVPGAARSIVVIGGAGGVGSIAIQLARRLTDLTVIATASRDESRRWVTELGAHHVVDHREPLAAQISELGLGAPGFVLSTQGTDTHLGEIIKVMAPQGRIVLIDDPKSLDVVPLKSKSLSLHWEFMFTRSLHATSDRAAQGHLLDEVADMVDAGTIRSTMTRNLGPMTPETLREAHAAIESGTTIGKVVLERIDPS